MSKPYFVDGKYVGEIGISTQGVDEYQTSREKRHVMNMFQGFGISDHILKDLKKRGIGLVNISFGDRNLICSVNNFLVSEKTYVNGGDAQHFVSIKDMLIVFKSGQSKLM